MIQHCIEKSNTEVWKFRTPFTPMFINAEKPEQSMTCSSTVVFLAGKSETVSTPAHAAMLTLSGAVAPYERPLVNYFICPFFPWTNFLRHKVALVELKQKGNTKRVQLIARAK